MASNFYRSEDGPRFILGHALELGFIVAGIIAGFVLVFAYSRINKKRDQAMANGAEAQFTDQELSEKGDRAVTFRYMY